ncbi:hypothetical protein [Nostoc sp. JL33]|nr:hypothetical protein [Nostoc sp. JL33]
MRYVWGDRLPWDAVGEIFRYILGQKTQCKENIELYFFRQIF